MRLLVAYTVLLAVLNFPFVTAVEAYASRFRVRRVFAVDAPSGQRSREIRNALLTTPIHAVLFFAMVASTVLRTTKESVGIVVATFLLAFLWTEVWHYVSHFALHLRSLHFIHREHHRSHLTGPWSSVSFSLLEKFIFSAGILAGLALISRFRPLSALGIVLYYIVYFFTNVLGHSNIEFQKPGYYRTFPGKLFNSPSYHALHHARYVKNYGLLTPWLDTLFGTVWHDVAEVQTRAGSGAPLTRLGERLSPIGDAQKRDLRETSDDCH